MMDSHLLQFGFHPPARGKIVKVVARTLQAESETTDAADLGVKETEPGNRSKRRRTNPRTLARVSKTGGKKQENKRIVKSPRNLT